MDYLELNTKNFCAIYFTCAQKRHVELDELYEFYRFFSKNLRKETRKSVNILCSNYYLSQVCYDYDDLFEMDEEQFSLKKDVSLCEVEKQLGWMDLDLLVSSMQVAKSYFDKEKEENNYLHIAKQTQKRENLNERTL